jgi:hypothetical protein
MGRLVGLDHFLSQEALMEEKSDANEIRRAKGLASDSIEDEADSAAKDLQRTIAQRMQQQFDGHILRRTPESLDWLKKPLITLPPYKEVSVVVKPTAREMKVISELADHVKER